MEIVSDLSKDETRGSVLITGFRGFGLVGYLVSKYMALSINAKKRGYILLHEAMPPLVMIEEDGVGYPFDIYHSREKRVTVVVNRALPERELQDEYVRGLARWISDMGFKYVILAGGLSREFRPRDERHEYRWLPNSYYKGPKPEAPLMETGLGVVGPLALLYIYLDYYQVPAIMVLPYAVAERVDYDAVLVGLRVITKDLLEVEVSLEELEKIAKLHRMELERIERLLEEQEKGGEQGGIYI